MKRFRKPKSVSTAIEPALAGALDRSAEKLCSLHPDSSGVRLVMDGTDAFALRAQARRALNKLGQARHDAATARALGYEIEEPEIKS